MTMKKQLVRATLVLEAEVDDKTTALEAAAYLAEAVKTITAGDAARARGKIELVKVSDTGKQSRTKLGDIA